MPVTSPRPIPENVTRRAFALLRRQLSAKKVSEYPNTSTQLNNYETEFESDGYALSFTKGLHHGDNGILTDNTSYEAFVEAINRADATDFTNINRGISTTHLPKTLFSGDILNKDGDQPSWRGWESPRTGHYYDLEGPDPDAVSMPPVPELTSDELSAEMAEVYALALLRDSSFSILSSATPGETLSGVDIQQLFNALSHLDWYSNSELPDLTTQERRRRAARFQPHTNHDINNPPNGLAFDQEKLFRGSGPGAHDGPYVSQYMLQGNRMEEDQTDANLFIGASIVYGSQEIDQKVSYFPAGLDYMLHWNAYLDVQNGANFGEANRRSPQPRRFIDTPRDLATYVRFDQLYQAYLNACLFMLDFGTHFPPQQPILSAITGQIGPGFPDKTPDDSRQGFASFGGPHILSLVTEVATRCLKAVRRQKFNYHRRARPERLAALIALEAGALGGSSAGAALSADTRTALSGMRSDLAPLLALVREHNQSRRSDMTPDRPDRPPRADEVDSTERSHADAHLQNSSGELDPTGWNDDLNYLLPMAFAEGSPMHPSYGAGHATVAGGCVTMLKAFFHTVGDNRTAEPWPAALPVVQVEPGSNGEKIRDIKASTDSLTIAGELNKLAANISLGRNMAGVHFYTDYYESSRMGERIATGILIEQLAQYPEPVEMDFHTFDGDYLHMLKSADDLEEVSVKVYNPAGVEISFEQWWNRHQPSDALPFVDP